MLPTASLLTVPLAGIQEIPTGGIDTWYAPHAHTEMADKDFKLLSYTMNKAKTTLSILLSVSTIMKSPLTSTKFF